MIANNYAGGRPGINYTTENVHAVEALLTNLGLTKQLGLLKYPDYLEFRKGNDFITFSE